MFKKWWRNRDKILTLKKEGWSRIDAGAVELYIYERNSIKNYCINARTNDWNERGSKSIAKYTIPNFLEYNQPSNRTRTKIFKDVITRLINYSFIAVDRHGKVHNTVASITRRKSLSDSIDNIASSIPASLHVNLNFEHELILLYFPFKGQTHEMKIFYLNMNNFYGNYCNEGNSVYLMTKTMKSQTTVVVLIT